MALPIQALPKGLIGLLDINTGGVGPPMMSDLVAGTYSLDEHYMLGKRERIQTGLIAGGVAAGDFTFAAALTVPGNEAWYVRSYSIIAAVAAALTYQVMPTVIMPFAGGTAAYALGPAQFNQTSALASLLLAPMSGVFVVPPGSVMGGRCLSISAAIAVSVQANIDFVRFRL